VEAIEKLPYPRDITGIKSFLGHACFYSIGSSKISLNF
jgi:hypothetical protein